MSKRILSAILAVVLAFSVLPGSAFAVETADVQVKAGTVEAVLKENEAVDVPVVFTENAGVAQIMIQVDWDETALELVGVTYNALPDAGSALIHEIVGGTYRVYAGDPLSKEDYVGINEPVFTLNFKVRSGAEAKSYDIKMTVPENREALSADMQVRNLGFTVGSVILTKSTVHSRLQQLPEDAFNDTNLWAELTPDKGYYKGETWNTKYKSITIPVTEGDQIYASSFQDRIITGGTSDGICVVYFYGDEVIKICGPAAVYKEYSENGYLTIPAGVNAVSIPMWKDNADSVVNLLTLPSRVTSAEITVAEPVGGEAPQRAISGTEYTGQISWSPTVEEAFAYETVYTAKVTLIASDGYKFTKDFTATVNGETANFAVNADGTATGSVAFGVTGKAPNSHLQWVEDDSELYADTNLWTVLEPKKEYHTGTKWRYDHATVYSVTIPVKPGDKIYASSFGAKPGNGGTSNGIAVTFFNNDEVVKALGTKGENTTYAEFVANGGYLVVPEGANAVCIPVWKNDENAVVKLLTLPERPTEVVVGDVNGDGTVTPKDAMILIRYVNTWPDVNIVSMSNADINKDGAVTPKDAMLLIRYVNNWPGYKDYFVSP